MPTYRNDGNTAYKVKDYLDVDKLVLPGATVQTNYLFTDDGNPWTKTADTPYYNPVLAVNNTITSTGSDDPTTIDLKNGCDQIKFWNNSSADITVFFNATNNTPGYLIPANAKCTLRGLSGYVEKLILEFSEAVSSGELIMHELEE